MPRPAAASVAASDDPSTDSHQELLTEHFGFNPRVFIDALVFAANELLYNIGAQFQDFAKHQLKKQAKKAKKAEGERGAKKDFDDMEAERGTHAILTLLENALDHTFDLLELYCLKTVFGIRPSEAKFMTLAHHRGLDLRTPEERVKDGDGEALSAKDESLQLQEREIQLQKQLAEAKKVRHALRLANLSANRSLNRAQTLAETFSVLLGGEDGAAQLPTVLPQSARKLSADASSLLKALRTLLATNALGSSLVTFPGGRTNERDRKRVMEESGASEQDKRAWEKGREGYINWETNRILRSIQEHRLSVVGDLSTVSTPSSRKRRKTEENVENKEVPGEVNELERLAEKLEQR